MTTSSMKTALDVFSALSIDELLQLNKILCATVRERQKTERAIKTEHVISNFRIGQIVTFFKSGRGRGAGFHMIKISNFNRAGDCVVGHECDRDGKVVNLALRWTVAATQIKAA